MEWQRVAPVIVSIIVIILIAALRAYSKTLAAVTATMPVNVALTLWIVYSAENGEKARFSSFARSMVEGIIPTTLFVLAAWLAARAGWNIAGTLLAAYAVWAVSAVIIFRIFGP